MGGLLVLHTKEQQSPPPVGLLILSSCGGRLQVLHKRGQRSRTLAGCSGGDLPLLCRALLRRCGGELHGGIHRKNDKASDSLVRSFG